MLERFSIVVFSAKNDGGVNFREKYDLGAIQGSKYPKNGNFEAKPKTMCSLTLERPASVST